MDDRILQELRVQTSILRAAFRSELEALEQDVGKDATSSAIVSHLRDNGSTKSGDLKAGVQKLVPPGTEISNSTIGRRLADLETRGVIEHAGQTSTVVYSLTGLIA